MPKVLTVSPDFTPKHIAGWYIFNTWLQQQLDTPIHIDMYDSFDAQRKAIADDKIDLIYANPYDAAMLVREKGFTALVTPLGITDETVIATKVDNKHEHIEDLKEGINIATTDDPDVHMMGMIMLEPADLNENNTNIQETKSYVLVAKQLIQEQADIGFFLKDAYHDLSNFIKDQLKVVISSDIQIIRHVLLAGPELEDQHDKIRSALLNMKANTKGAGVLRAMGMKGWENQSQEDTEFMIDLMDTLTPQKIA